MKRKAAVEDILVPDNKECEEEKGRGEVFVLSGSYNHPPSPLPGEP